MFFLLTFLVVPSIFVVSPPVNVDQYPGWEMEQIDGEVDGDEDWLEQKFVWRLCVLVD